MEKSEYITFPQLNDYIKSVLDNKRVKYSVGYSEKPYMIGYEGEDVTYVQIFLSLHCGPNTNKREFDNLLSNLKNNVNCHEAVIVSL